MKHKKSCMLVFILLFAFTGCNKDNKNSTGPDNQEIASENWDIIIDGGEGTGTMELTMVEDSTVTAAGEFIIEGDISSSFVVGAANIDGTQFTLTATGTAAFVEEPSITSPFTLTLDGTVDNGESSGYYIITYSAPEWPPQVSGSWTGILVSGGGITNSSAIHVIQPSASTIWTSGQQNVMISWSTGGLGGNVNIELYNGSSLADTIASGTTNDGSYNTYDISSSITTGSNYRVKITSTSSSSNYDNSDYFSISGGSGSYEQDFPLGNTGLTITMVWIPPGSFMQGRYSGEQGSFPYEDPQHLVTIANGFWMGKYEVTQAQWEAVAGSWGFWFDGLPDYPAESVSWDDITNTFLPGLNSQTSGSPWRLPSESEWEYACRAGTTTRYYWGDDPNYSQIGTYAWYYNNINSNTTHTVGTRQPNTWGLYDMSGNVYEWCEDSSHDNYIGAPSNGDAWLSPTSSSRVVRGGSWAMYDYGCRSACRNVGDLYNMSPDGGFRLVRNP